MRERKQDETEREEAAKSKDIFGQREKEDGGGRVAYTRSKR